MKILKLSSRLTWVLALVFSTSLQAQFAGQVINFSLDRYNSLPNGDKETVHDGENLAVIHFRGWTPANEYQTGASIGVDVTGEPSAGSLPAKMTFYTGALEQLPRMTILENGWIGIGTTTPQDLLDINGNTIIRGDRVWFGLNSTFGDGGLAFKHQPDMGFAGLPTDVLGINSDGEFEGGVYVGCPGLRVCGTLEAECIKVMRHLGSEEGNIVAFGGSGLTLDCAAPGEGDFIAYGANGDFIAHHGHFIANEGDFRALAGNMTAFLDITSTNGNIAALSGNVTANQHVTAENGNVSALAGDVIANQNLTAENGDVTAMAGSVVANQHVIAENGDIASQNGDIMALTGTVVANQHVIAQNGNVAAQAGDVIANQNLTAENGDVTAMAGSVVANQHVIAQNGNIAAPLGNVEAGQDVQAGGNVMAGNALVAGANLDVGGDATIAGAARIGNITGDPGTHALAVGGSIIATEVKVALQDDWPDYVFRKEYRLPTLAEVKRHIEAKGHLPGMPSAREIEAAGGIELGEQQRLLTEKVEELYLHLIQLSERVEQLEKENAALREALAKQRQ